MKRKIKEFWETFGPFIFLVVFIGTGILVSMHKESKAQADTKYKPVRFSDCAYARGALACSVIVEGKHYHLFSEDDGGLVVFPVTLNAERTEK